VRLTTSVVVRQPTPKLTKVHLLKPETLNRFFFIICRFIEVQAWPWRGPCLRIINHFNSKMNMLGFFGKISVRMRFSHDYRLSSVPVVSSLLLPKSQIPNIWHILFCLCFLFFMLKHRKNIVLL
jgi:hypothetical protein